MEREAERGEEGVLGGVEDGDEDEGFCDAAIIVVVAIDL